LGEARIASPLAEISKEVATGAHAILILDGAGYHAATDLKTPDNLSLLPLPGRSVRSLEPPVRRLHRDS